MSPLMPSPSPFSLLSSHRRGAKAEAPVLAYTWLNTWFTPGWRLARRKTEAETAALHSRIKAVVGDLRQELVKRSDSIHTCLHPIDI